MACDCATASRRVSLIAVAVARPTPLLCRCYRSCCRRCCRRRWWRCCLGCRRSNAGGSSAGGNGCVAEVGVCPVAGCCGVCPNHTIHPRQRTYMQTRYYKPTRQTAANTPWSSRAHARAPLARRSAVCPVGPAQRRVRTVWLRLRLVPFVRCVPAARCASPHAPRRCVYFSVLACSEYAPVTCSKSLLSSVVC